MSRARKADVKVLEILHEDVMIRCRPKYCIVLGSYPYSRYRMQRYPTDISRSGRIRGQGCGVA